MSRAGAKPGRVHQVHRTIRAALNEALRRKRITENPALFARAPKVDEEEVEPYSVAQVKGLLETAQQRRNSARWAVALALGLRQGEALGLQWSDVDLNDYTLLGPSEPATPEVEARMHRAVRSQVRRALLATGAAAHGNGRYKVQGWQAWDRSTR